jgi:hypothetical protein
MVNTKPRTAPYFSAFITSMIDYNKLSIHSKKNKGNEIRRYRFLYTDVSILMVPSFEANILKLSQIHHSKVYGGILLSTMAMYESDVQRSSQIVDFLKEDASQN